MEQFDEVESREDDPGHGDYTKERHEIFADLELEDLLTSIRKQET